MKKIFAISTILIFCLSFLAIAGPDLTVTDLTIDADSIVPGEKYHYTIDVKNVGDEDSTTRLPYFAYVDEEYKGLYPGSLTTTLSDRQMTDVATVTIISEDGIETEVVPEFGKVTYMAHEESEEQIQKRIDGMMERANSLGWSEQQIQEESVSIQEKYGNPHEKTAEGALITLGAGETARYDSADSFKEFGAFSFPVTSLSIDPIPVTLTF